MIRRILAALALAVSVIALPWYLSIALGIFFALSFDVYLEMILLGFVLDMLYGASIPQLFHFSHIFLAIAIIVFGSAAYARQRMVFYRKRF